MNEEEIRKELKLTKKIVDTQKTKKTTNKTPERKEQSYYYKEFEKENNPKKVFIEKIYKNLSIIKISVKPEEEKKMREQIEIIKLNTTPQEILSASFIVLIIGLLVSAIVYLLSFSIMMGIVSMVVFFFIYKYLHDYPKDKINARRLKSSTELVMSILYMVVNMRHTPNLEHSISFTAENLEGPLGDDFKKMLWDVQSKKYNNVEEALQEYLTKWSDTNPEFVDSMYLVINSLYQVSNEKRKDILDKALDRILQGSLETMIHYSNALKTPIEGIYMLGITLPVFGLIMMPIVAAFLSDLVSARSMMLFYNILLPAGVLFMIQRTLSNRPLAFKHPDISNHPDVPPKGKFWLNIGKKRYTVSTFIPAITVFIIGFLPLIYYLQTKTSSLPTETDIYVSIIPILFTGIAIYIYTRLNTFQRLKLRADIERLDAQFADTTFQIGNRISEGLPLEQVFLKIAKGMKGSASADFFDRVANNMEKLGMSAEQAIFDPDEGALKYYPSNLVDASMKILMKSSKKSLEIAASSVSNVSQYLRNIHLITEKIKDVLAETLSSLSFQASVIAPMISGIVIGLTSMIMTILTSLGQQLSSLETGGDSAGGLELSSFWSTGFFNIKNAIPLTTFQLIVGFYFIEVVVLMMMLASKVESAGDPIKQQKKIGSTMIIAVTVYMFITLGVTILFGGLTKFALALS